MRVLVACEFSGRVREAFRALGHDALSCDLLPADDGSPHHYMGDVRDILEDGWDMMIAHPPCTYLALSGVRWLHEQEGRWELMREGAEFFKELLNAPIPKKAIENSSMHGYAMDIIGRKYDQIIHPYMFGEMEKKKSCLWLDNLPRLVETNNVKQEMKQLPKSVTDRMHRMAPGKDRWKLRSVTYQGIANAMAEQWGAL